MPVLFTDTSKNSPTGWSWFFGDERYNAAWTQMNTSSGWVTRNGLTSVALPDGSILLMGGCAGGVYSCTLQHDVWRSVDRGATWTLTNASAGWSAREYHTSVVLPDGSIVLMGGSSQGYIPLNDVWRSTDKGLTWVQQTSAAEWSTRYAHTSVVLPDGSIVLMGGWDGVTLKGDVWRSTDKGLSWIEQTASAEWPARRETSGVVLPDGTIALMGGIIKNPYDSYENDIWKSPDKGVTWTQVLPDPAWSARAGHTTNVMPDGSVLLLDGTSKDHTVWRSKDNCSTWTVVNANPGWQSRWSHTSVTLPDGSVVLMGGVDYYRYNDVWRLQPAGSTLKNPVHTYTTNGNFSVVQIAYNSAGYNSTSKRGYIFVNPEIPDPCFTANPRNGTAPLRVTFTDCSQNALTWAWRFGDGTVSNTRNPVHTYTKPGTYTINLTVSNGTFWDSYVLTKHIIVTGLNSSQIGIFRNATGFWSLDYNADGMEDAAALFGRSKDIPVVGDWDKDRKTEIGFFRPANGYWYLDYDNNGAANRMVKLGKSGDTPVVGDWDRDNMTEIGIRNATGYWFLDNNNDGTADVSVKYGTGKDIPVVGDWDKDGMTEISFFRPLTGYWYLDYNNDGLANKTVRLGRAGDTPVVGDWDNDRMTEIGIRNATGYWFLDNNNDGISETSVKFGTGKDIPVVGDWDNDGMAEIGFFRPSTGYWYLDYENDGIANKAVKFAQNGDTPVVGHWI